MSNAFVNDDCWERKQAPIRDIVERWRRDDHDNQAKQYKKQLEKKKENEESRAHLQKELERVQLRRQDVESEREHKSAGSEDEDEDEDAAPIAEQEKRVLVGQEAELQEKIRQLDTELAGQPELLPPRPLAATDGTERTNVEDVFVVYHTGKRKSDLPTPKEALRGLSLASKMLFDALTVMCRHIPGTVTIVSNAAERAAFWDASMAQLCVSAPESDDDVQSCVENAVAVLESDCVNFQEATAKMLVAAARSAQPSPPAPDRNPKFRPILLIDEWGSRTGGIAAFNFQLACDLAELEDTAVYVCLTTGKLPSLKERAKHPSISFVRLRDGIPQMLGQEVHVTTLIGHGDITGSLLSSISETQQFRHCQKWLFLHTTPRKVDPFKNKEAGAEKKHQRLVDLATAADTVFCVGKLMLAYWAPSLRARKVNCKAYHPILNAAFIDKRAMTIDAEDDFIVTTFGRTSGVLFSKGFDMLKVMNDRLQHASRDYRGPAVCLRLRGIEGSKNSACGCEAAVEATDKHFQDAREILGVQNEFVSLSKYGTHDDVRTDLAEAQVALMPSVIEPFGLAGLEALAAGVLPIIPRESGLAQHLEEFIQDPALNSLLLSHVIVDMPADSTSRGETWAQRLKFIYRNREKIPPRRLAAQLRDALLEGQPRSPMDLYEMCVNFGKGEKK